MDINNNNSNDISSIIIMNDDRKPILDAKNMVAAISMLLLLLYIYSINMLKGKKDVIESFNIPDFHHRAPLKLRI